MPIDRLELGRLWSAFIRKVSILRCADFEAKIGCANFETYPRTVHRNDKILKFSGHFASPEATLLSLISSCTVLERNLH